jgi:hypothetical protein
MTVDISLVPRCTPSKLNKGAPSRSLARRMYAAIMRTQQNLFGLIDGLAATAKGPPESGVFLRTSNADVMNDKLGGALPTNSYTWTRLEVDCYYLEGEQLDIRRGLYAHTCTACYQPRQK